MLRLMLLIFVALYVPTRSDAQQRAYRKYLTQQVMERLKTENADYAENLAAMEDAIRAFSGDVESPKILPLVFHVFHPSAEIILTESQILKQVKKLNEMFDSYTAPVFSEYPNEEVRKFYELGVSSNIRFCVPQSVNDDYAGINFYATNVPNWKDDDAMKKNTTGGATPVDTKHYINVWVVDLANAHAAGYAQMPGGPIGTDGIVIDFDYFLNEDASPDLNPYAEGKTLAHLMASYLGVYELWNEDGKCLDDFVDETPVHSAPHFTIDVSPNSRHFTMCSNGFTVMHMNFMDNTDDVQLALFTEGQKKRMKVMLSPEGLRKDLANETIACLDLSQKSMPLSGRVQKMSNSLLLYPNPASGNVQIRLSAAQSGNATITVVNTLGMQVHAQSYAVIEGNQDILLDCEGFPSGNYFVRVQFSDKTMITKNLYIYH